MLMFNINEPGVVSFMYKVTNYVRTQCGCFRHKFNSCVQGFETPRKRLWNTRFVWFSCNIILYMNIQNILSVGVFLFFKFYVWIKTSQQHMKTDIYPELALNTEVGFFHILTAGPPRYPLHVDHHWIISYWIHRPEDHQLHLAKILAQKNHDYSCCFVSFIFWFPSGAGCGWGGICQLPGLLRHSKSAWFGQEFISPLVRFH